MKTPEDKEALERSFRFCRDYMNVAAKEVSKLCESLILAPGNVEDKRRLYRLLVEMRKDIGMMTGEVPAPARNKVDFV